MPSTGLPAQLHLLSSPLSFGLDGIREGICRCCRQLVKRLKCYNSHGGVRVRPSSFGLLVLFLWDKTVNFSSDPRSETSYGDFVSKPSYCDARFGGKS